VTLRLGTDEGVDGHRHQRSSAAAR
jgi:hypothetical protein